MSKSFLAQANKSIKDVRSFIKEASTSNSLKYKAEKGAKHILYFPYKETELTDENGDKKVVKELVAQRFAVHEWQRGGKYEASICHKDLIINDENGNVISDGSCPICDRVQDGWGIYNYRKELEEATCKLTGDQREKHLETAKKGFMNERKAKAASEYLYILVAKFKNNGKQIVMNDAGKPEYELKVWKMSVSRLNKLAAILDNNGEDFEGVELSISYGDHDDIMMLSGQATFSTVYPDKRMTKLHPDVFGEINEDVAKFEWDGVEKSFVELNMMTHAKMNEITENMFEEWDKYTTALEVDPSAKYMEYVSALPESKPSIVPENNLPGPAGLVDSDLDVNSAFGLPEVPTIPSI